MDQLIVSDVQLGAMVVEYFCNAYREEGGQRNYTMEEQLFQCLLLVLNSVDNDQILTPITNKEVKNVIFSMEDYNVPRLNDIPLTFSQEF